MPDKPRNTITPEEREERRKHLLKIKERKSDLPLPQCLPPPREHLEYDTGYAQSEGPERLHRRASVEA